MLSLVGEKYIFRDGAEPGRNAAAFIKFIHRPDGLVKGLLGQFFGKVPVPGPGHQKSVDLSGVLLIDLVHGLHLLTSFISLSVS